MSALVRSISSKCAFSVYPSICVFRGVLCVIFLDELDTNRPDFLTGIMCCIFPRVLNTQVISVGLWLLVCFWPGLLFMPLWLKGSSPQGR